jgi:hypothetical protein
MVKSNLFAIIVWSILMSAPVTLGKSPVAPDTHAERTQSIYPFELIRKSIVVAESEQEAAERGGQTTSENKDPASGPEAEVTEKNSKKSGDGKTKPLKPFVPSEEIAAEQAVDFPVDI